MTMPTPGDVHVNAVLTNMSTMYRQNRADFWADRLAPIIPSDKQSNIWYEFTKDYWFRDAMKKRAPGAPAAEAGYGLTTRSFFCDVWALRKPIADQTRANEDAPLNSDRNATQFLTALELIRREKSFVAAAMAAATWTTTYTGVTSGPTSVQFVQWDQAAATPIDDVETWKDAMRLSTGYKPNVLAIGKQVWTALRKNAQIIARITGGSTTTDPARVRPELVAQLMELDELAILEATENTANEGATFAGAFIAGKTGCLMYRDTSASIEAATAIRTFTWQQYAGSRDGTRMKSYRIEERASDIVEIESAFVHVITAADLGFLLATMVA